MDCYGIYRVLWLVMTMELCSFSAPKLRLTLRGRIKPAVTKEEILKCILCGGLETIVDILSIKGHAERRDALKSFVHRIEQYAGITTAEQPEHRGRLSRIFASTKTGKDHCPRAYGNMYQDVPNKSGLPEIDCTPLPKMSPDTVSTILKQLPNVDNLFSAAAEQVLLGTTSNLQNAENNSPTVTMVTWALTRDPYHYVFDFLSNDRDEDEADDSGNEDTDSEDSEAEDATT